MKHGYFIFILILCQVVIARGQYSRYIIQLKDKKGTPFTLANPSAYLSPAAIERRTSQKISLDSTDLPVSPDYLDSIRAVPNLTILNKSNWFNQVCIRTTDASALAKVNAFTFVRSFSPVASRVLQGSAPANKLLTDVIATVSRSQQSNETPVPNTLNYGSTFGQIRIHEGDYLHNRHYTGEGKTIAILDAGFFGYKTNPAFDSVRLQNRVLGEWDFVSNEASVNEDNSHGMFCFSILAANRPGIMVGSAPRAKYYLFRTEDAGSEYPVEEQNWVAAAEMADSLGVDMISSSLGYADFDDPSFNHPYPQRNGNTVLITRAADLAAKKGILVMVSAGNTGNNSGDQKFVGCPADADSVVTVGAVDVNGNIAGFSSWGPNGAGKRKPNVVSVGQGTVIAGFDGTPSSGNGTSFANPNMAGLIACLWQAYPEFTNMEVIDAVQRSAHKYSSPDDRFGYGIPNFRIASRYLENLRVTRNAPAAFANGWIRAFPVPSKNNVTILLKAPVTATVRLRLLDISGKTLEVQSLAVQQDMVYNISFTRLSSIAAGAYLVQYDDGQNKVNLRLVRQ